MKKIIAKGLRNGIFILLLVSNCVFAQQPLTHQFNLDHALIDIRASKLVFTENSAINVYISPPKTQFSKQWMVRFKKDTTKDYRKTILSTYKQALMQELANVVSESRQFNIVDSKRYADIVFLPSLKDIYIYAPDYEIKKSYVMQSGKANFSMQVKNKKGVVLAQYADTEKTRRMPKISTLESNLNDFKELMSGWSTQTVAHLSHSLENQRYLAIQPN